MWLKESNRPKHLLYAIPAAFVGTILFSTGLAFGMEFKDKQWGGKFDWLDIAATENDVPAGKNGELFDVVEFYAYYELEGTPRQLGERSFFQRKDDKIYYVDGVALRPDAYRRQEPKVGRNDPCPCGSGKKYKKCCGASKS